MAVTIEDRSGDGSGEPAKGGFEVNPNNTTVFTEMPRALYVGGAGNLAVVMHDGTALTFTGVTAGSFLPIRVRQVKSTGTTASAILGLY
jgi:hypothetical protein